MFTCFGRTRSAGDASYSPKVTFMSQSSFYKQFPGYSRHLESIRHTDFPNLKGHCYLDHTGAELYPSPVLESFTADLKANCYGNPHSGETSPSASATERRVEEARHRVLNFFDASPDDYSVVFTSNATAALRIASEMIAWGPGTEYWFFDESHTSVIGVRNVAKAHGSAVRCFNVEDINTMLASGKLPSQRVVLAVAAQSNFGGFRPAVFDWIQKLPSNFIVLLDAASYLTSSIISLKRSPAAMFATSFYKIFGFPTGLGALLVRKDLEAKGVIRPGRTFFGGGTVTSLAPAGDWVRFHSTLSARYEDGTLPFLDVIGLCHAFDYFHARVWRAKLPTRIISDHVTSLAQYLYEGLSSLAYTNRQPLVVIYSSIPDAKTQGPIIALNFLRPNGEPAGYHSFAVLATKASIHLRVGCFCNPGGCMGAIGFTAEQSLKWADTDVACGGLDDVVDGYDTGAVRVTVGWMNTRADIDYFLNFVAKAYLSKAAPALAAAEAAAARRKAAYAAK